MPCPPDCGSGQSVAPGQRTAQVGVTRVAPNQILVRYNAPEGQQDVAQRVYAKSGSYYGIRMHGDQFKILRRDFDDSGNMFEAVEDEAEATPTEDPPEED